jgi:hypothetical protein
MSMKTLRNAGWMVMVAGALIAAGSGDAEAGKLKSWSEYAVPFTCGLNGGDIERAVPGTYAAAVNILNPRETEVIFTKHVALTFPPVEQVAGDVSDEILESLPGGAALQVDCGEIQGDGFTFPGGAPASPYLTGFLVVRADSRLHVSLTQTATGAAGEVSVDTEQMQGRSVRLTSADKGEKATVCHVPPGNPSKAKTLSVGLPSVPAHLGHGDYLGDCE